MLQSGLEHICVICVGNGAGLVVAAVVASAVKEEVFFVCGDCDTLGGFVFFMVVGVAASVVASAAAVAPAEEGTSVAAAVPAEVSTN